MIPKRILGKTGLSISMLSFGGGSNFSKNPDGQWEPLMEKAIELGINYFDTASSYEDEARFGEILPKYRDQVIIGTNVDSRDASGAMREFERSLSRMKTSYVDILFMHAIDNSDSISALEKGVYKQLVDLKVQKMTRFIGFSSMNSAARSRELLEKLDIDVTILAMNATTYGSYATVALPVAKQKNVSNQIISAELLILSLKIKKSPRHFKSAGDLNNKFLSYLSKLL